MGKNVDAGFGDPYWYEWSIGLSYVVDMLSTDAGISSVTLQKSGEKGLDDVVVKFSDGRTRFIQVKHTRAEETLTFGDLVVGESGEPSLLRKIAAAWKAEVERASGPCDAWIVTNRAPGRGRRLMKGAVPIVRPPLDDFLAHIAKEVAGAQSLGSLTIPSAWSRAWTDEWLPQLDPLPSEEMKLTFLKSFQVRTSQLGLEEIAENLLEKLSAIFKVDRGVAYRLRNQLDGALRTWATSLRRNVSAVTPEIAYEALCLIVDEAVGEHDLTPPEPFFESRLPVVDEIANLLVSRAEPIIFVVGEPGSGKTALLSSLANRRETIIDARYYAYRPVTPENQLLPADAGRTANERALWSDLLLQIREIARGQLLQLKVPVHAASLPVENLRAEVLRLANALGEQQERPFVIAVDGIDHAARAGAATDSFLNSLVPPSLVPPHVVFLIGGQPPEAFSRYPVWLRAPEHGVKRYDLPILRFEDILALVQSRLPNATPLDQENSARDIWHRCKGNTLSSVFAAEEAALLADDLSDLASRLDTRQLAAGVVAYYSNIWSSVTRTFRYPEMSLRLAACLSLMPIRATPAAVRDTFRLEEGAETDWGDFLRQLRPLVVEEPSGFRVFHNDVRVFLLKLLKADATLYMECASRLADHLLRSDDLAARHAAVQNLLGIAGRSADQAALFTPTYVIEGRAIRRSIEELTEQGLVAADALVSVGADWNLAHLVATGLQTLKQLRVSLRWRDAKDEPSVPESKSTSTRAAERRVPNRKAWSPAALTAALVEIDELFSLGEYDRATGAFRRWFGGMSPAEIAVAIGAGSEKEDQHGVNDEVRSILAKLGEVSVAVDIRLPPSRPGSEDWVESHFATGLLKAAGECEDSRRFDSVLGRAIRFYLHDAQKLMTKLVEKRAWMRCKIYLCSTEPRARHSWPYRLQMAATASLLGDLRLRRTWTAPLFEDRTATIQGATSFVHGMDTEMQELTVLSWTALMFGLEEPMRDASNVREEIETIYRTTRRDERKDSIVSQVLHAAAMLGSLIATIRDGKPHAVHAEPRVVARIVEVLIKSGRTDVYLLPISFHHVAAAIVQGFVECSSLNSDFRAPILDVLRAQVQSDSSPDVFLEAIWRALAAAGHRRDLVAYADSIIGEQGLAWADAPADRYDIVRRLAVLLDEIGETSRAAVARSRLRWLDVGYSGHKEYALRSPLQWFKALAEHSPASWIDEGLRLFALSREASRTGDNELSWEVEGEVLTVASINGPSSIARLTRAPESVLKPGSRAVLSGLIGLVERVVVENEDMLAIWAFAAGELCWQVDDDGRWLVDVREALVRSANRVGATDLPDQMRRMAPAEFDSRSDEDHPISLPAGDHGSLDGLSVDEAMRRVCDSDDLSRVTAVLERIAKERPPESEAAIEIAWAALARRPVRPWWLDRADSAYKAIMPMLTPARRWDCIVRLLGNQEPNVPEYRADILAENMDDLCCIGAIAEGRAAIQRGLGRLLDMHETWLSGAGRLPRLWQVPLAIDDPPCSRWRPLFVELLFQLLCYDEQEHVKAALRGLGYLMRMDAALYAQAVALAEDAEPAVQRRFLLMAESLVCRKEAQEVRDWLVDKCTSSHIDIALSAWSALRAGSRALGESDPEWPSPNSVGPLVVPAARPLLTRPPIRHGLLTAVGRASTRILDQLQAALGEDVDDLRSGLAASVRDDPPRSRPRRMRNVHVSDMVSSPDDEAELERLYALLCVRERQGRFASVPTSRLAQALVPFADPFIFMQTPRPSTSPDKWPNEDDLDALVRAGNVAMVDKLTQSMEADLDPSIRLIAGTIRTYSSKHDVLVSVDHRIMSGPDIRGDDRPSVLNGRASLIFDSPDSMIVHHSLSDQVWLAWDVGGLAAFADATMDFFPSRVWHERLLWNPSAANPLVWMRDGHRVAWFEQIRGPLRHLYPSDFVHRQPYTARWVCQANEWDRLVGILGTPRRCARIDLQTLKIE